MIARITNHLQSSFRVPFDDIEHRRMDQIKGVYLCALLGELFVGENYVTTIVHSGNVE
jgi:hypothetical protein